MFTKRCSISSISQFFSALPPVKSLDGSIKADQIHQRKVAQGKHHLPAGCLSTSSHHCIIADHIWPDTLSMEQFGAFWHPKSTVFRHSRSFYDASGSLDRDARHMLQESQGQIPGTTLGANVDSTVVVKNVDLQSLGPGQNKYSIHKTTCMKLI